MAMQWTDEQLEAINAPSGNGAVLVSAAAGSGKTAVLVERILNKILNEGMSIDRMLVVTFTEAAASEMRDKIIRRMYAELAALMREGKPVDEIKRQIRLSVSADILTIDAFCIRVLRNNFYLMGIDPDFRIADSAEAELLSDDAAEALFTRLYMAEEDSEESRKFNHLLNIYATNRSDENLKKLVLKIHRFTQSFAKPVEWLDEKAKMYSYDMAKSDWVTKYVPELFIRSMGKKYYASFLELARGMCGDDTITEITAKVKEQITLLYGEMANGVCILLEAARELANAQSFADANAIYQKYVVDGGGIDSMTLKNKPKDITADLEDWKFYCKARNDLKKQFFEECSAFSDSDISPLLHGDSLKTLVDEIVWLVKEFDAEYTHRKDLRSAREFSDIEHLVYNLFLDNEAVREQYQAKYDEIMIDEYQDTNGLQNSIFELISRDGKNMFMVGDLKQSIYRFRGGDPTIFIGKSRRYGLAENADTRIDLSQNFRSRQEILHGVNDVFERIMSEELGDVRYAGKEKIVRMSDADDRRDEYKSEAHFVVYNKGGDEELSALEAEAEFIADRIFDMISSKFQITENGKKRDIMSRDICILSLSVKKASVISDALQKRGVNSYVEIEDYFEKREIRLMMSLISVIDNHLQDIPLISVMRSPIGGFTDKDLAKIRIYSPSGSVYHAVCNYRADETDITNEEIARKIKCRRLIKNLEKWRNYVKRKSVANLIWSIYVETGLYDFMGALEGGEESQANLRLLYERAKQYEQSGFKGLFNFIKYIEKLESRRNDLSSANLVGEGHDVVHIMTIHKSKGLEFPVVFLAGMGKRLSVSARGTNVLLHKDLGFGLRYADADGGYFEDTLFSRIVAAENMREELSEAMRVLYVAMTRPKCKLIAVASKKVSDSAKKTYMQKAYEQIEKWERGIKPEDAKSYADWIYPAAMKSEKNWDFQMHDYVVPNPAEADEEEKAQIRLASSELREAVRRSFEYEYKYLQSGYIPSKTSVTALKQKNNELDMENADRKYEYDPIYMEELPEFMREKRSGAEIGTAHHQVMAYIDLDTLRMIGTDEYEEFVDSELERIAREGQIESSYCEDKKIRSAITKHISEFFKSPLGERMLGAERVYREQPFQIEIGADVYDPSLDGRYGDEKLILQGVIDCFFENENGEVVLLDYKTDRCANDKDKAEIKEKYTIQLELYSDAVYKITKKRVSERFLYLFAAGTAVEV